MQAESSYPRARVPEKKGISTDRVFTTRLYCTEKQATSKWVSLGTFLFQVCVLGNQQRPERGAKVEKEKMSVSSQVARLPTMSFSTPWIQRDILEKEVHRGHTDSHRGPEPHQPSPGPGPGWNQNRALPLWPCPCREHPGWMPEGPWSGGQGAQGCPEAVSPAPSCQLDFYMARLK